MSRKILPVLALAMLVAVLASPNSAGARGCSLNLGNEASVKSNVSCHITSVVTEKADRHITQGQTKFRVYARGFWHCETAPIEGYHVVACTRHRGVISIATE